MTSKLTKEDTDRFIEVGGVELHYNEAGDGPALICTHGGGPGAIAWDNTKWVFGALAGHLRVILLDLPGFGESQMNVSRHGVALDVFCARPHRDFLDTLGIERAHLYGSSAFSAAALRFGIDYPERTGKIVIRAFGPGHEHGLTDGLQAVNEFAKAPSIENMEKVWEQFTPRPELRPRDVVEARFPRGDDPRPPAEPQRDDRPRKL